jgi:hypothetical protein
MYAALQSPDTYMTQHVQCGALRCRLLTSQTKCPSFPQGNSQNWPVAAPVCLQVQTASPLRTHRNSRDDISTALAGTAPCATAQQRHLHVKSNHRNCLLAGWTSAAVLGASPAAAAGVRCHTCCWVPCQLPAPADQLPHLAQQCPAAVARMSHCAHSTHGLKAVCACVPHPHHMRSAW